MTTRHFAGLILTLSVATGATALAADDHQLDAQVHHHARHVVREVRRAVHESLREVRREVRLALRDARLTARDVLSDAGYLERSTEARRRVRDTRQDARQEARDRAREARNRARDARDAERQARDFRQITPTDDPCGDRRRGDRGHACEVRDSRFGAPGSALTVDALPNGGIRVEGWDQPEVLVRAVIQTWADSDADARALLPQVRVNAAGAQVTAEGPDSDGWRNRGWSVSYRIWAPRQTALALEARNGGVSIVGMRGESRFTTRNGGVTLDEVGGHVVGRTTNGGVNVRLTGGRWDGAGLDVETTNGGVQIALPRDYSAALEVSTVNGGLRSDLPVTLPDDRRHEIRTTLGGGGPLLKVRTVNGGVRLAAR